MGDVVQVFLLALLAMLNPTLLAAVTLMLFLPSPKRLMLGYLLGAYLTSISLGMVIVFALHDAEAVSTSRNTISPAEDLVVGSLLLLVAFALATDRDQPLRERRARRKNEKVEKQGGETKEPLPMRLLGRGSPRIAFVVGVLLSFPGVSYLVGLGHIDRLDAGVPVTVLLVIVFCLIQQTLLEVPLIGYALAPDWTQDAVSRFRAWLGRNVRRAGMIGAAVLSVLAIVRGLVGLLG
jgi:Sap, sulfolipid-1-addressing protein